MDVTWTGTELTAVGQIEELEGVDGFDLSLEDGALNLKVNVPQLAMALGLDPFYVPLAQMLIGMAHQQWLADKHWEERG
jgi:hypothetical protein